VGSWCFAPMTTATSVDDEFHPDDRAAQRRARVEQRKANDQNRNELTPGQSSHEDRYYSDDSAGAGMCVPGLRG
jgi:hypothetical protein